MALYGEKDDTNYDEILETLIQSDRPITIDNYTDVDALIFAELSGLDVNDLFGEEHNAFYRYNEELKEVEYRIDKKRIYSISELIKAYEKKYNNMFPGSDGQYQKFTTAELVEAYIERYNAGETGLGDVINKLRMLQALEKSPRYQNIQISNFSNSGDKQYEDEEGHTYTANYKAVTVHLNDIDGTKVVAYAGTGASIFSWIEDGRMSSADLGIGAQVWGKEYAKRVMDTYDGNFVFTGYSKGGNQALYSATTLWAEYSERIKKLINIDGPGFSPEALNHDLNGRTFREVMMELYDNGIIDPTSTPYTSFVGKLMINHPEYHYMNADGWLIFLNHDFRYWNVTWNENGDPIFEKVDPDKLALSSQAFDTLIDGLLANTTLEDKQNFIDTLENFCKYAGINTVSDMAGYFSAKDDDGNLLALKSFLNFYYGKNGNDIPYMSTDQRKALDKAFKAVMADENLEEFLVAWRRDLEEYCINYANDEKRTGGCEIAAQVASVLKKVEPFYPILAEVMGEIEVSDLIDLLKYADGYLDSVGGLEQLLEMDSLEIMRSVVDYYDSLPFVDKTKIKMIIGEALEGGIKGTVKDSFKKHPVLTVVSVAATVIAIEILAVPIMKFCTVISAVIAGITILIKVVEIGVQICETALKMAEAIADFCTRIISEIHKILDDLIEAVLSTMKKIATEVSGIVEAGKYTIKESVQKIDTVMKIVMPDTRMRIQTVTVYAIKESYINSHIHITIDFGRLSDLTNRMWQIVDRTGRLENELENFYWKLTRETEETGNSDGKNTKMTKTLAEKYHIRESTLRANQYGTLLKGCQRLEIAENELFQMAKSLYT